MMQRQGWSRFKSPRPKPQSREGFAHRANQVESSWRDCWETPAPIDWNNTPQHHHSSSAHNIGFYPNIDQNPFDLRPSVQQLPEDYGYLVGFPVVNQGHSPQFQDGYTPGGFEGIGRDIAQLQGGQTFSIGYNVPYQNIRADQPVAPHWEYPAVAVVDENPYLGNQNQFGQSHNPFVYDFGHAQGGNGGRRAPRQKDGYYEVYRGQPHHPHRPIHRDWNRNQVASMNRVTHSFKKPRPIKPAKFQDKKHALSRVKVEGIDGDQVSVVSLPPKTVVPPPVIHAPDTPAILYHYTTLEDHVSILRDKCLKIRDNGKGSPVTPAKTSRFGQGIYFTDISPHETTEEILINNYGIDNIYLSQAKKTEVCFEFPSDGIAKLVFCEDKSCLGPQNERRRKIWMTEQAEFKFGGIDGFYYIRKIAGFGVAASVVKRKWNEK